MYSLKAIVLQDCPYCEQLINLFKTDLKYIKINYIKVNENNKQEYKNDIINTFPQIYLICKKPNGELGKEPLLIGGYDDIKGIVNIILSNNLDSIKKNIYNKYPSWSNKSRLRLIQLFMTQPKRLVS